MPTYKNFCVYIFQKCKKLHPLPSHTANVAEISNDNRGINELHCNMAFPHFTYSRSMP